MTKFEEAISDFVYSAVPKAFTFCSVALIAIEPRIASGLAYWLS